MCLSSQHHRENRKKFLNSFRAKNSVDSLSEDSGYCDRDIRSLPTVCNTSAIPLEDEEDNVAEVKSLVVKSTMKSAAIDEIDSPPSPTATKTIREFLTRQRRARSDDDDEYDDDICYHSMENLNRRRVKARRIDSSGDTQQQQQQPKKQQKLMKHNSDYSTAAVDEFAVKSMKTTLPRTLKIESPNVQHEERPMAINSRHEESSRKIQSEKIISISLPELSQRNDISRRSSSSWRAKNKKNPRTSNSEEYRELVSSLPDSLDAHCSAEGDFLDQESVAVKNFNLYDISAAKCGKYKAQSSSKVVDISASCANLTLLNYSDEDEINAHSLISPARVNRSKSSPHCFFGMSANGSSNSGGVGKLPANIVYSSSDEDDDAYMTSYRSKELSSLLEEISAHFDKNMSILNDREENYEPPLVEVKAIKVMREPPPKPPPRRTQIKTSPNYTATKKPIVTASFDRDPTNLKTTYAESLEKCNFDIDAPIKVYDSRQNLDESMKSLTVDDEDAPPSQSTPIKKRNFVSSTPNLNFFDFSMKHVNHYSSTDNTAQMENDENLFSNRRIDDEQQRCCISMKEIPTTSRASSTGILTAHSTHSKSGLSVSFCPIVSEISWHENPDYDDRDDDYSDEDVDMDERSGARNDSLVNYYGNDAGNDDDDSEDFDDFIAVGSSTAMTNHQQSADTADDHRPILIQPLMMVNDETIEPKHATSTPTARATFNEATAHNSTARVDGSSKMLVETQTPSEKFIAAEAAAIALTERKVNSQMMTTVPQKITSNDEMSSKNNSVVSAKQQHGKKSFFSRISSGLRFSFRGKKSKKLRDDGVFHYPVVESNNNNGRAPTSAGGAASVNNNVMRKQRPDKPAPPPRVNSLVKSTPPAAAGTTHDNDFIFIPLKDTNDNTYVSKNNSTSSPFEGQLANGYDISSLPPASDKRATLPQVDRQSRSQQRESPPRLGGITGKPPLPKQPPRIVGVVKRPTTIVSTHARASSTPRDVVDNGEFYNQSMIGDGLQQYYKTGGPSTMSTAGSEHKIGLIETNLDTDETIINGKTQSLMELGIGLNSGYTGHRRVMQNVNGVSGGGSGACASATDGASGRHHKSMEFLLDKENRHIVLVS